MIPRGSGLAVENTVSGISGQLDFALHIEAVSQCSIWLQVKENQNFNHRNTLGILRIVIFI